MPLGLSSAAGLLIIWRIWLWRRARGLPKRLWLWAIIPPLCLVIALYYRTLFGREAGVALLVLLMLLKLLEARTPRDAIVGLLIGFFVVLTQFLVSQSMLAALWATIATGLGLTGLLILNTLIEDDRPDLPPARELLAGSGRLLLLALPFMLAAFLLFPRIQGPLWRLPADSASGRTGLSGQMSPGDISRLVLSGEIAFRVQFEGKPPDRNQLYWRGPVLTLTDGRTWLRDTRAARASRDSAEGIRHEITLEPHGHRWLLALDRPGSAVADSELNDNGELLAQSPQLARRRYVASSTPPGRNDPPPVAATRFLPADVNPQAVAFGKRLAERHPQADTLIPAVLRHFSEGAYAYTLTPGRLGKHPVDDFLFRTRQGFCEHYAAAFVTLVRAAGHPARVVTGYQGGERNPVDGYWTLRQSDAHAWAEVWSPEKGWQRVDPTAAIAPARIESNLAAAVPANELLPLAARDGDHWLRGIRFRWEAVINGWNQWVLGFDPERQRQLLKKLGLGAPDWQSMTVGLAGTCAIILSLIVAWAIRQPRHAAPEDRLWLAACRQAEKHGIVRAPWEGPLAFAGRVLNTETIAPQWRRQFQTLAHTYAALRYGRAASDPGHKRRIFDRLGRQLHHLKHPGLLCKHTNKDR